MYSNNRGDLPRNSSDKNVHHKHTRRKGTQKYLRESCYHRIEYTAATFLTTFMWKRPLNSVVIATTTHRKPNRVSDGTDTQVRAQMINKCKIKMVQRKIYNIRDLSWEGGRRERERENTVAIKIIIAIGLIDLYEDLPPRTVNSFRSVLLVFAWSSSKSIPAVVQFIRV